MIEEFIEQAGVSGANIILSGVQPQPREMLARIGLSDDGGGVYFAADYSAALHQAEQMTLVTVH